MVSRRELLAEAAAAAAVAGSGGRACAAGAQPLGDRAGKRLAVITTVWRYGSHAWHMAERFLHGYPKDGGWHRPPLQVVSAYVDQIGNGDLSKGRAEEFGFKIYPSVAEALRQGGSKLAVDAVLIIGEHGRYGRSEWGQTMYPRYEFFKQVAEVFAKDGRSLPVFNDKHLSWKWEWAQEMVDTSRKLGFPLLAGSSLPQTWRMPAIDLPYGAEVEEAMCVAYGGEDSYDFHALETIQCLVERRRGGETGVTAVRALRGEAVWKGLDSAGWDRSLFDACLARSQTLAQPPTFSHRYPTTAQMREMVRRPVAYRVEYADGLKATMLLLNGLVSDFTFAARLKGRSEPLSTLFYLPPNPNVTYSAALMGKAEELFVSGKAPFPIERTLLTTGLVAASMQSLAEGEKRIETPHLSIRYRAPRASQFVSR
jgi:hypothetical protein